MFLHFNAININLEDNNSVGKDIFIKSYMDIKSILKSVTADFKVKLTDFQLSQFEKYYEMLVEWNEKINLTAICDPEGVAIKHFADSLAFFNYIDVPENSSVIDVGTGAGFPGLVLKIARPDINLTLLDSLNKRLIFLNKVLSKLGLSAQIIHSRAEDGAKEKNLRESFDFSTSRAVAQLNVLSEYCLPYVKNGGKFIALKGPDAENEIISAESAIKTLGGKVSETFSFSLPKNGGNRSIVMIKKIKVTPDKYPRNSGKIKSKPL